MRLLITLALMLPSGSGPPPPQVEVSEGRVPADHRAEVVRPYRTWLAQVRQCESRGRYRTNTGNGFYGAYQFLPSSWHAVGGRGLPHGASPAEQDYRAVRLLKLQGRGAWPVCG